MSEDKKENGLVSSPLNIAAIVPVYNVERYLGQCVGSLLAQTYPLHEIVLVDDGSTDGSGALCDRLSEENASVRVVHKRNAGLGYARNTGLDSLSDDVDYVTFVDSDDWLEPDMVETLVRQMRESGADCVIAGFTKRDGEGGERFRFQLEDAVYEGGDLHERLVPRVCGSAPSASDSIPMSACSSMLAKTTIDEHSLRFPSEREVLSEDFFFKYAYLNASRRVRVSSCVGYCYRDNDHSLTTSYRPDRFEASLRFYELSKKAVENGPAAGECVQRLQKTLFIYVRASIAQERRAASGKTRGEAIQAISNMTQDPRLLAVIDEYPFNELGFRQRGFLRLVRSGAARILYVLAEAGKL